MRDFCDSQGQSGTFDNGDMGQVGCLQHGNHMYTLVASQADTGVLADDQDVLPLDGQPGWALDGSTCNVWLFVNNGNMMIDYLVDSQDWTSDGFDFQKHVWVWDNNGVQVGAMNKVQRDHWGVYGQFQQLNMVSTDGLNQGLCNDGSTNMVGGCADVVEVYSQMPFVGMHDAESIADGYTPNNRFRYDYSLYCRYEERMPMREFCASQDQPGTYMNGDQ